MAAGKQVSINDPIHGSIELSARELAVLDTQPLQRLRNIKQLGFSERAFPGATHSRFAHSLGAMQMVTRMFDRVQQNADITLTDKSTAQLRQATRLAMLCHDLGHPPLSHVSERMMPKLSGLALPTAIVQALDGDHPDADRQATHEDYTLKLLYDSELGDALHQNFADDGIDRDLLASLITGKPIGATRPWLVEGVDWLNVLHAMISGELDADRMDYLRRDAHACGVGYGQFDHNWLCANLTASLDKDVLSLALKHRGVWAFENFLLARYHMFLAVYYHHTSVCLEHLLGRFFAEGEYTLGSTAEAYLQTDDVQLIWAMRQSKSPWARAVLNRRPWSLLVETHSYDLGPEENEWSARLAEAKIPHFVTESRGRLSRYLGDGDMALNVVETERRRVRRIDAYTPLYERFHKAVNVSRIYCDPVSLSRARSIITRGQAPNLNTKC